MKTKGKDLNPKVFKAMHDLFMKRISNVELIELQNDFEVPDIHLEPVLW